MGDGEYMRNAPVPSRESSRACERAYERHSCSLTIYVLSANVWSD